MINRIYTYLAMAGGFIVTLLLAFMRGKSQGKAELEAKQNDKILQDTQKIKKVENTVAGMSADERKRLRKERYTRD